MYDVLIVGAGMFGSTLAWRLRREGKHVLVLEQRQHVGGNCWSRPGTDDIEVHEYGPHIFHTDRRDIFDWFNSLCELAPYTHRVKAICGKRVFSLPVNLMTMHQIYGTQTPDEARAKLAEVRVPIAAPANLEEHYLATVGPEIYDLFFYGYTRKQWDRDPRTMSVSLAARIPVRLTYNDNYFFSRYQGIPVGGYRALFARLLENVEVKLNSPFTAADIGLAHQTIYSGRVDEFFGYKHGPLEYRSLQLTHETTAGDVQGMPVANYCGLDVPQTRITEHKHFEPFAPPRASSVVTTEVPCACGDEDIPYYPILDEANRRRLALYQAETTPVRFGGRLGRFAYLDMDQAIASALEFTI